MSLGGYNTIRWNVAGKERIVIWIITEANCCWPEWKEVKLYVIIHTKEREILASQLSHIVLCQAWTQLVITLRGLYVHEWIALACTPLLPDHIHLDERAGGNTNWISLASLMCRFNCLVPSRWHKQHVTWRNKVGIKRTRKLGETDHVTFLKLNGLNDSVMACSNSHVHYGYLYSAL